MVQVAKGTHWTAWVFMVSQTCLVSEGPRQLVVNLMNKCMMKRGAVVPELWSEAILKKPEL